MPSLTTSLSMLASELRGLIGDSPLLPAALRPSILCGRNVDAARFRNSGSMGLPGIFRRLLMVSLRRSTNTFDSVQLTRLSIAGVRTLFPGHQFRVSTIR